MSRRPDYGRHLLTGNRPSSVAKSAVAAFKAVVLFETMDSAEAQDELAALQEMVARISEDGQFLLGNFDFPLDQKSLLPNLAECWARGMAWDSLSMHQFFTASIVVEMVAVALAADAAIKEWLEKDVAKFEFERMLDIARWAATNVANGMYVGARMPKNWSKLEPDGDYDS